MGGGPLTRSVPCSLLLTATGLATLLFQYGRYLLIARAGGPVALDARLRRVR